MAIGRYMIALVILLATAMHVVAFIAGARVPATEVAVVTAFALSLRLCWELWRRTVGRLGERWVRWNRRQRRAGRRGRRAALLICPARATLTLLIFAPAAIAFTLTHRFKLRDNQDPKSTLAMPFDAIQIPTDDGLMLDGWFIPCGKVQRTIVICHGAGANKGNFIWFVPALAYRGYNLLMFDFRAHGGSGGRRCTYGILEARDVLAVVRWLKANRAVQAERVVGLGSSLGAFALACAAADEPQIDAVILDSPFTSPRAFARHHAARIPWVGALLADGALGWMMLMTGADFLNSSAERAVARLGDRPLLVIHGGDDMLMPAAHAQQLNDAASGPHEIWFGPGPHSNIVTAAPDEYAEHVFSFLTKTLP